MGRKPAETKRAPTSIKVDPALWREARVYALQHGTTLSELIEECLRRLLAGSKKG